ncbi:MAG: ABC transporter substrate-binding protein [Chloroflexi bacterium]|nr:ABC transporter substrate-binding protein [Chloroflexota bacterium]
MKRTILFVFMALAILLAACASPTAAPAPTSAPAQPAATKAVASQPTGEPIKIGIIAAFSGTNAVLGDWMKKGTTLAVEEKNKAGGIQGRQIQVITYDDEADPTKSVNLAQKVATEDKVMAVWATSNSTSALADIPIFAQYKIPQFTNGTNVDITNKGSAYIFRATPAGPSFEDTLIDFLITVKGMKKFAIIADTSAYGKGEGDYQEAALKRNNLQALTREAFGIDDKDFTGQLTKILQTQPEVLLLGSSEVASGLIAKQARQLGFKGQIAGGAAVGTPKFIETAGETIAEGVFFTTPWLHDEANEMSLKFVNAYKARWNETPEFHGANTYDGTKLLLLAMEKANPLTSENVAAELHKISGHKGLQGTFNVTAKGETITGTLVGIIKGGKLTVWTGK